MSLAPRAWRHQGILLGLLVLGTQNGLPFFDTTDHFVLGYAISNYMVFALLVFLMFRVPRATRKPGMRSMTLVGYVFVIWWFVTVWHSGGEPTSAAVGFGRNFLTFALLAVLFPLGLSDAQERREMLFTVCAGATLYAVGEIVITVSHHPIPWLVHPVAVRVSDVGLQRVYAFMSEAAVLLFAVALGAALLAPDRRIRRAGGLLAVVSTAALILQQTRAVYLSLAVALILVIFWWFVFVPSSRGQLAGRTVVVVVLAAGLVAILALVVPSVLSTYAAKPLSRLSGAIVQVSSGTGNLAYRFRVAHDLLALLHGDPLKWLYGLGFLSPRYHYFPGLPLGSIKNSDLGLVDGIMLFGLVGVALTYLLVLIPMKQLVSETRSLDLPVSTGWLSFALMVWLTHVLLASYTLQTLWEQSGQVLVAMVGGLALQLSPRLDSAPQAVPFYRARQIGKLETAVPTGMSSSVPGHGEGTWAQQ